MKFFSEIRYRFVKLSTNSSLFRIESTRIWRIGTESRNFRRTLVNPYRAVPNFGKKFIWPANYSFCQLWSIRRLTSVELVGGGRIPDLPASNRTSFSISPHSDRPRKKFALEQLDSLIYLRLAFHTRLRLVYTSFPYTTISTYLFILYRKSE